MMEKILAILLLWLMGAPVYLPGVLARLGIYKSWYLVPFMPPFAWRGIVHMWPFSAIFVCAPFMSLLPLNEDERLQVLVGISIAGAILAVIIGLWQPRWAKPTWQRRLEDRYDYDEIKFVFIPAWRKMDRKEWGRLIETEEGLEELVSIARGG
jgi:hypothetical protein